MSLPLSPRPLTPSVTQPSPADLRTAVNQIQSLLLLLDSALDDSTATSTLGEPAAAPEPEQPADGDGDDAASDSSDAPLMQQRQQQRQQQQQPTSRPGLAQMLPALLLPLQPSTPLSIAQLNMESVAMGFPNIMSRYRGAVQHAFNLASDLHRGIGMLSNPMPDPVNPARTRQAALSVAGRLMRETPKDRLQQRVERVRKRQRITRQPPTPTETVDEPAPPVVAPAPPALTLHVDAAIDASGLDHYLAALRKHLARDDLTLTAQWPRSVRVDVAHTLTAHLLLYITPTAVTLTRVVVHSRREAASHTSAGLATLSLSSSRFPAFRRISKRAFDLARAPADLPTAASASASWDVVGRAVIAIVS